MPLTKRTPPAITADAESPATPGQLLAQLADPDVQVRRSAARALGDHPSAAAELCRALPAESADSVREAMFTALMRINSSAAARELIPFLQSEDVGLRNGAVEALKDMPDAVAEQIEELFRESGDAKIFGIEILGALAHPESPRWMIRIIESDSEFNVCAAAVNALAECGDRDAVEPLHRLLERFPDEPYLQFAVRTAIARIAGS